MAKLRYNSYVRKAQEDWSFSNEKVDETENNNPNTAETKEEVVASKPKEDSKAEHVDAKS